MATSYSANQYDNAFVPKHLQSWQTPKSSSARPKFTNGTTKPIATTDGRVLFQYNRENSFKTNYINTWDLPKRLPGSNIDNSTARDIHAYEKLKQDFSESKLQLTGQKFNYKPVISYGKKQKATKNTRDVTSSQTNENPSDSFSDRDGGTPGLDGARFTPGSQGEADTGRSENVGEGQPKISNKIPLPDFSREFQRDEERREVALAAL